MPDEPMTLIERLRNPAWESDGLMVEAKPARLNVEQTRRDMNEAADTIEGLARMAAKYLTRDIIRRSNELPSQDPKP